MPDRMDGFESVYSNKIIPVMRKTAAEFLPGNFSQPKQPSGQATWAAKAAKVAGVESCLDVTRNPDKIHDPLKIMLYHPELYF